MIAPNFDIRQFINSVKDKEKGEIIIAAQQEARDAIGRSALVKDAVKAREQGSIEYADLLGGLIAFVNCEFRPPSVSEAAFQLFKPICKSLIEKKKMKPDTIKLFREDDKQPFVWNNKVYDI